ncbi:nuclease [Komagataeibacter xylinus]|uniref:Nuclease n=1 Tax=Komagataeibacter xylinus TaxID=28448 RepID=A0A318PQA8_KOMXY|nr:nuclease-related domain-containing protein [Komagataeibacter xylinus]PYD55653.1 nuclease [Komagataeibacter xylinus]GBQ78457.1 NERD domain-containing protein [Komagataeibacter xylinus NBRC 15237]
MVRLRRRGVRNPGHPRLTPHEQAVWRSFRAGIQGDKGENAVSDILNRSGLPVLHDVILPAQNERTTQIDHLFLSVTGIHVVETKRYGGELTGHPEDERWRQRFAGEDADAPPRLIYSPLIQNAGHCRAVYALVRLVDPAIQVFNHVVMAGSAILSPALASRTLSLSALETLLGSLGRNDSQGSLAEAWRRIELARPARKSRDVQPVISSSR